MPRRRHPSMPATPWSLTTDDGAGPRPRSTRERNRLPDRERRARGLARGDTRTVSVDDPTRRHATGELLGGSVQVQVAQLAVVLRNMGESRRQAAQDYMDLVEELGAGLQSDLNRTGGSCRLGMSRQEHALARVELLCAFDAAIGNDLIALRRSDGTIARLSDCDLGRMAVQEGCSIRGILRRLGVNRSKARHACSRDRLSLALGRLAQECEYEPKPADDFSCR